MVAGTKMIARISRSLGQCRKYDFSQRRKRIRSGVGGRSSGVAKDRMTSSTVFCFAERGSQTSPIGVRSPASCSRSARTRSSKVTNRLPGMPRSRVCTRARVKTLPPVGSSPLKIRRLGCAAISSEVGLRQEWKASLALPA